MILKFCKECCECCQEDGYLDIFMSHSDVKKINADCVKKTGQLYKFKKSENFVCHFLSLTGCRLEEKKRPLDCRLFPMTFNLNKNKPEFFFLDACPKISEIPINWIEKTMKEATSELKNWSKKEIMAYVKTEPQWRAIPIRLKKNEKMQRKKLSRWAGN